MDINNNSSLKQKQAYEMIVDDSMDLNVGQKTTKINYSLSGGITMNTVEPEVGKHQPRPAL